MSSEEKVVDARHLAIEPDRGERTEPFQKLPIMIHDRSCLPAALSISLDVHPLEQGSEHLQHLIRPSCLDEIDGTSPIQQPLPREEPHPRLVRLIEVSEQVHDVFQIEKRPLSFGLRKRLTLIPARDGLRSNPQRISHISGLHRPFLLEGPEFSSNDIGVHSLTRMKSPSGSATVRITRGPS